MFAVSRLDYPELGPIAPLLQRLHSAGLTGAPAAEHFDDVLQHVTKDDIHRTLSAALGGVSRSMRKERLIELARENIAPDAFLAQLGTTRLVVQRYFDSVRYVLFLFFGRIHESMSQFTMRDLGVVRMPDFRDNYEPRFGERDEALENYFYAVRATQIECTDAHALESLLDEMPDWPEPAFSAGARRRDKLAYALGRKLERLERPDEALAVYAKGESTRCVERYVRILLSMNRRDEALEFLETCLTDPRSDEEWLIAKDIYEQTFENKRTSALTDMLRTGEVIRIDESQSGSPERAAAGYFENRGVRAYRVENSLWRTLFGLLFWDELFDNDGASLHSPFDFLPASLKDGSFYPEFEDAIESRLAMLDDRAVFKKRLLKVSTEKYGAGNGVFRWNRSVIDAVFALADSARADALRPVLRRFCRDYTNARYGYPDLMLIDAHGPRFVEIKTEGDQLRRNQMLRLKQLRAAGFQADVVRIEWVLDPNQTYVVVDVETTGGRGEHHRVTEIGAVKVRNGKVIDRFETLLNPQRAIPPGIVRLTGISAEMVADAPFFIDVADAFETFMGDAIFVAHNVDFDYRFIAQEFRRVGRQFRHAKLCTCASMRKLYPGHSSYSLASLCRQFDIPLKRHHRAMCDAEAAAELLLLVNEKRSQRLSTSASTMAAANSA